MVIMIINQTSTTFWSEGKFLEIPVLVDSSGISDLIIQIDQQVFQEFIAFV